MYLYVTGDHVMSGCYFTTLYSVPVRDHVMSGCYFTTLFQGADTCIEDKSGIMGLMRIAYTMPTITREVFDK